MVRKAPAWAWPLVLLVAGCGGDEDPGYTGTFTGSAQGQVATVKLTEDEGRLTGTILFIGQQAEVEGTVDGDRARGKVRLPQYRIEIDFEATRDGDRVEWIYPSFPDARTGRPERYAITLTRAGGDASGGGGDGERDARLVGRWVTEVGGGGLGNHTVTTRIHCVLDGDGSFRYGGGQSLVTLHERPGDPGATAGTGPAGVVGGRWRSQGGVLSYQQGGGGAWIPLGRYELSGNDMLLYTANGGKQLWSRE